MLEYSYLSSSMKSGLAVQFLLLFLAGMASAQLSPNFYARSCPAVISIIQTAVFSAVALERRIGASLLRLHFHDSFVQGCDASILLDDTADFKGEKTAIPNTSLRGFELIDYIKAQLEKTCPGVVSCADILTIASREGVAALGGPRWDVALGRRDSTTANLAAANTEIPSPFLNLDALIVNFQNKGFTPKDLVALSGAHTIGKALCRSFRTRLYNEFNINPVYAAALKLRCPIIGGDDNLANLDTITPEVFDNAYYSGLTTFSGLVHSDQQLYNGSGGSINAQVFKYALNPLSFFVDFSNAMIKMDNLSLLTGTAGQIRTNCRKVN